MPVLRILLADDHILVRQGIRRILEANDGWEVVAEVSDGHEAVRQASALRPDIAVLDIRMPMLNGIDATAQILRDTPHTRVLILSMHLEESYVVRALRAGALGYLLKDSASADLISAIQALVAGKTFFSPSVAQMMLNDYMRQVAAHGVQDRYELLSDRERQILQMIAEGRSSKEIADHLCLSTHTVSTHRANILAKLDLHSATDVVLYAVRHGLIG